MSNKVGHKISFNLYGNLDTHQEVMRPFLSRLKASGNMIFILTGALMAPARAYLESLDYEYDVIVSLTNYLALKNFPFEYVNNKCVFPEEIWWGGKAKICEDQGISMHFESNYKYGKYFERLLTRFIFMTQTPLTQIRAMNNDHSK